MTRYHRYTVTIRDTRLLNNLDPTQEDVPDASYIELWAWGLLKNEAIELAIAVNKQLNHPHYTAYSESTPLTVAQEEGTHTT